MPTRTSGRASVKRKRQGRAARANRADIDQGGMMNIDEAIDFKQSGFSEHFRSRGEVGKAEPLLDAMAGTVEEWEELVACYK